jgi:hypothetical protein
MPRLLAKEGDGQNRRNRAQGFAGVPHEATRNINGDDRRSPARCFSQGFRGRPLQFAAEPCTKDRIHYQFRAIENGGRQRLDGCPPPLRMTTRLAGQMIARAEQGDANGPAGFDEMPGGDEAVAAVVSGSAQNDDGPHLPAPPDLACDGPTGVLHHIDGWHAGGYRQTIGFSHLANAKQRHLAVHHVSPTSPLRLGADIALVRRA